jgi:hypothetical protein
VYDPVSRLVPRALKRSVQWEIIEKALMRKLCQFQQDGLMHLAVA